jgi:hypothetical protein
VDAHPYSYTAPRDRLYPDAESYSFAHTYTAILQNQCVLHGQ